MENKETLTIPLSDLGLDNSLPDPVTYQYYKNLEKRILWLDAEVDDYFLEYGKYILQWNQEDFGKPQEERIPIRLLFFSPGGSLDINNAMIDIIKQSKTKVIGINMGIAQSAGAFIYLACHERLTMPKAGFLLHRGRVEFGGSYDEIVCQVMEYQRQMEELEKYVLANTNIDEETFNDNFGTEWFISAKEALDFGIAHKIIEDIDEIYS